MELETQSPWSTRTIVTILVVVVLCGAGLAYSKGWFDSRTTSEEVMNEEVGTQQRVEQVEAQPENAKTMSENAPLTNAETK